MLDSISPSVILLLLSQPFCLLFGFLVSSTFLLQVGNWIRTFILPLYVTYMNFGSVYACWSWWSIVLIIKESLPFKTEGNTEVLCDNDLYNPSLSEYSNFNKESNTNTNINTNTNTNIHILYMLIDNDNNDEYDDGNFRMLPLLRKNSIIWLLLILILILILPLILPLMLTVPYKIKVSQLR